MLEEDLQGCKSRPNGMIWRNAKLKKDGEGNGSIGIVQPKKSLCANMRRG